MELSGADSKKTSDVETRVHQASYADIQSIQRIGPELRIGDGYEAVIAQTIELRRGGRGVPIYIPIRNGQKLDGYIVEVFHLRQFLDSAVSESIALGYSIAVLENGKMIYERAPSGAPLVMPSVVESAVRADGVRWVIRVWPGQELLEERHTSFPTVILAGGLLAAVLLTLNIFLAQKGIARAKEAIAANYALQEEVAERKRAQEAEERFATILEGTTDFVAIARPSGKVLYINHAGRQIAGLSDDADVTKSSFADYYTKETLDLIQSEAVPMVLRDGAWTGETTLINPDGGETPVSHVILGHRAPDGTLDFLSSVMRDITDVKEREHELRESEEKFRQMADNIDDVFFIQSPDMKKVLYLSPAYESIWGRPVADVYADPYEWARSILPEERERVYATFARMVDNGESSVSAEYRIARPDGEVRWILARAFQVLDAAGNVIRITGIATDITERKANLDQLLLARKELERLVDERDRELNYVKAALDEHAIVAFTDPRGKILFVNDKFCAISQYSREELLGQDHRIISSGYHPKEFFRNLWQTISSGRVWKGEVKNRAKDGSFYWVDTTIVPFLDDSGKPSQYVAIRADITERKRAEDALIERTVKLQESEHQYRFLAESVPQIIWGATPDGHPDYYNQRWYDYTGMTVEETRDKGWTPVLHPDDRTNCLEAWAQSVKIGCDYEVEYRFRRISDGTYRWHLGRAFPMRDDEGRIVQWVGTCTDIDDQKRAEEELRQAHAGLEVRVAERTAELGTATSKLQAVMDAATHSSLIATDRDGVITLFNAGAERMLGYSAEEMIGKLTPTVIHDVSEVERRASELSNEIGVPIASGFEALVAKAWLGLPDENEWTYVRKDGSRFTVLLSVTAVLGEDGHIDGFLGVAADMTEAKRTEQELIRAREAAEAATRAKSEFLAVMSHEIRTPMNGVIGMTQLLLDTELDSKQRRFADTIQTSADSLLSVINDILDFSKIEAGKLTFESLDFDLRQTVEGTLELMSPRAQAKGVELVGYFAPDVQTHLRGDAARLRQVLNNLVSNAVKFTEEGEIVVRVNKELETDDDLRLRFEVQDSGIGISAEAQTRLFQAFQQADGSTTRKYGGTGLGLAIASQLVELMHGKIGVESVPGRGSRFHFTAVFEKQLHPAAERPRPPFLDTAAVRVLIVDDNITNLEIMSGQLDALKMRSVCSVDGEGALRLLRDACAANDPFQLVILDMEMPVMNGLALAHAIHAEAALDATRLIMLTSLGHQLDQKTLNENGIAACLVKPVKQSLLFDCIATSLAKETPAVIWPVTVYPTVHSSVVRSRRVRILVAEDNEINQMVALEQLRKLGHEADMVSNGLEAVQALQSIPYDVVFMDCMMPELDGFAATTRIRRLEQERAAGFESRQHPVHIIAMTANAMEGDRKKCLEAGMDDYLSKPVQTVTLKRALDQWNEGEHAAIAERAVVSLVAHSEEAPVDLERLLDVGSSDSKKLRRLVNSYLEQAGALLINLEEAIRASSTQDVRRIAHKLVGSSSTCGMTAIVPALKRLEQMGEAGELGDAVRLHAESSRQLERVRCFVEDYLNAQIALDDRAIA
jgi:PAS domain S-box-containing protein